jgi:alcohol dehydrogenase class IV
MTIPHNDSEPRPDIPFFRKKSMANTIASNIEKIRDFMQSLGLPTALKDAGVTMDNLEKNMDMILEQTPTDPGFYFGWYDLNKEQFKDIFLNAYEGNLLDMQSDIWR